MARRFAFGLAISSCALIIGCGLDVTAPAVSHRPLLDLSPGCDSALVASDTTDGRCRTPVIPWY